MRRSGHTDGDSIVFFPKSNVVHMGDDFVTYGFPFVDIAAGGSVQGMISGLENALAQLPADVKVIPGHGPISTPEDVRTFIKMLKDAFYGQQGARRRRDAREDEAGEGARAWQECSGQFISTDMFIETLYNDLRGRKPAARPVKHN